jgi:hypothetical protein
VLDALQLEEELVGMAFWPAPVFPAIVREDRLYCLPAVLLEERQDGGVEDIDGGQRQLAPGKVAVAVDDRSMKILPLSSPREGPA